MVQVARGKALVAKLRAQAGVRDPEALAAYLGRFKKAHKAGKSVAEAKKAAGGGSGGNKRRLVKTIKAEGRTSNVYNAPPDSPKDDQKIWLTSDGDAFWDAKGNTGSVSHNVVGRELFDLDRRSDDDPTMAFGYQKLKFKDALTLGGASAAPPPAILRKIRKHYPNVTRVSWNYEALYEVPSGKLLGRTN